MKYVKRLPELIKKFAHRNNRFLMVLHLINLTVGFLLYSLFFHKVFLEYYIGFLGAYFFLWPVLKKAWGSSRIKWGQYFYCVLFITFIGYFAMFLTMTFIINVPKLQTDFIYVISSNLLFSVGVISLGIYIIFWPIIFILGGVNFLLLNKHYHRLARCDG
jgi:hypothetical protein